MKKRRPSPRVLRWEMLDLTRKNVQGVKRTLPCYCALPIMVIARSAILALALVVVAMDLARWYPLRVWWYGELARRGKMVQHATVPKRAQYQGENHSHGLAN